MKTVTIPGFIYASQPDKYQHHQADVVGGVLYSFMVHDFKENNGTYTKICPFVMTFDLPKNYNPVEGFVKNLEAEKKQAMADFQARITEIDRQINQLLAIEMTEVTA